MLHRHLVTTSNLIYTSESYRTTTIMDAVDHKVETQVVEESIMTEINMITDMESLTWALG